jgi:hypothetical protein
MMHLPSCSHLAFQNAELRKQHEVSEELRDALELQLHAAEHGLQQVTATWWC